MSEPVNMDKLNDLIKIFYLPMMKIQIQRSAEEQRIYMEMAYGMTNIMPKLNWWSWLNIFNRRK